MRKIMVFLDQGRRQNADNQSRGEIRIGLMQKEIHRIGINSPDRADIGKLGAMGRILRGQQSLISRYHIHAGQRAAIMELAPVLIQAKAVMRIVQQLP